jgi:hypothetical protein
LQNTVIKRISLPEGWGKKIRNIPSFVFLSSYPSMLKIEAFFLLQAFGASSAVPPKPKGDINRFIAVSPGVLETFLKSPFVNSVINDKDEEVRDYTKLADSIDYRKILGYTPPTKGSVGQLKQADNNCYMNSAMTAIFAATYAYDLLFKPNLVGDEYKKEQYYQRGFPTLNDQDSEWDAKAQSDKLFGYISALRGGNLLKITPDVFFNYPAVQSSSVKHFFSDHRAEFCASIHPLTGTMWIEKSVPQGAATIPTSFALPMYNRETGLITTWAGVVFPASVADTLTSEIIRSQQDNNSFLSTSDSLADFFSNRAFDLEVKAVRIWIIRSVYGNYQFSTTEAEVVEWGQVEHFSTGGSFDLSHATSLVYGDWSTQASLGRLPSYLKFNPNTFYIHSGSCRQTDPGELFSIISESMASIAFRSALKIEVADLESKKRMSLSTLDARFPTTYSYVDLISMARENFEGKSIVSVPLALTFNIMREGGISATAVPKKNQDGTMTETIEFIPRLNRFPVAIPQRFTLSELLDDNDTETNASIRSKTYHLTGISLHSGLSLDSGHYTSIVVFPDGKSYFVDPLDNDKKEIIEGGFNTPSTKEGKIAVDRSKGQSRLVIYECDEMRKIRPPETSYIGMNFSL